ncbi:hypothetical protein F5884DRAFT_830933 [Xylogone sp. PMI_703]|nr:hypothetical protein F5884DRAFT_830933 [Xylogone sp. PMI_703]
MTVQEELYILHKRDEVERKRLDAQHLFLQRVLDNELIPKKIPTQGIKAVADVACGTGNWILDVRDWLARIKPQDCNKARYFHGFDITDKLFPSPESLGKDIAFSTHDMTKAFPSEFHGKFDIVHVRLLVFAVTIHQIPDILKNLVELLAPNGYLVWDDFVIAETTFNGGPKGRNVEYLELVRNYATSVGFSNDLPRVVKIVLEEDMGFRDVDVLRYSTISKPDEAQASREWYLGALNGVMPVVFRRTGLSDEETAKEMEILFDNVKLSYSKGVVPHQPMDRVVARKLG